MKRYHYLHFITNRILQLCLINSLNNVWFYSYVSWCRILWSTIASLTISLANTNLELHGIFKEIQKNSLPYNYSSVIFDFVNFQMLLGKFGPSKGVPLTTLQQQLDLWYAFSLTHKVINWATKKYNLISISSLFEITLIFSNTSTVVVYLSLWDKVAATFRGLLSSGNKTQSVNPKIIEVWSCIVKFTTCLLL